jgi:hypothetical protein
MSDVLFWSLAVFAVLGLPYVLAVASAWRSERRAKREARSYGRNALRRFIWPIITVNTGGLL